MINITSCVNNTDDVSSTNQSLELASNESVTKTSEESLSTPVAIDFEVSIEENSSEIKPDKELDLFPVIKSLNSYLPDNNWDEFKGGCSWYCAAMVPTMSATSVLEPYDMISYEASNLHDFDLNTVWSEGVEGYGIGEAIEMIVIGKQEKLGITHFEVINGYVKTEELWNDNSRIKQLNVSMNGIPFKVLHLADSMDVQVFDIGLIMLDMDTDIIFKFEIADVYNGDKYEDTVITELQMDGIGDH